MDSAKATLRFLRMSPRKVRLIADMVRGETVDVAIGQLYHSKKAAARPVRKLIESAAANAVNNDKMQRGALFIQTITVDDGPTYKRFRPRAHGRAAPLRKRTSHVNVIVAEKAELKTEEKKAPAKKAAPKKQAADSEKKAPAKKPAAKKAAAKKPAAKKASAKKPAAKKTTKKED